MKKALTIYVDDDADLTRICGTFVCEYGEAMSINMINVRGLAKDKKCMYFSKEDETEWFDEVTE